MYIFFFVWIYGFEYRGTVKFVSWMVEQFPTIKAYVLNHVRAGQFILFTNRVTLSVHGNTSPSLNLKSVINHNEKAWKFETKLGKLTTF